MKRITKFTLISLVGVSLWYSKTNNDKYSSIDAKLNVIIENSNKATIDSLKQEMMEIGWELDSMMLKYDYGFAFTN